MKAKGKNHGMGCPSIHVLAKMLKAQMTAEGATGEQCKLMDEHWHLLNSLEPEEAAAQVFHCKVGKCFDVTKKKVQWALPSKFDKVSDAMAAILVKSGGKHKTEVAPASGIERELQELLDQLQL